MSNIKEMVNWIKEERESSKQEVLKKVLDWLDENFFTIDIEQSDSYLPKYVLDGNFESKEQMLQSFKERFNIE